MSFRSSALRFFPLLLACALAISKTSHAQNDPPINGSETPLRSMTLDDAIAFAKTHQPRIRAAFARAAAQKSEAGVPGARWLPIIGATAQLFGATANNTTGTYVTSNFIDIPRIGGTRVTDAGPWQPYASTFLAIGVRQELFDFGRISAQSAESDALVLAANARTNAEMLDLIFSVEEAYFAVLAAKSIVRASNDAFERSRVHRDLAKAGVDSGLRSPIELTRAEADLLRFELARLRARSALRIAQAALATVVGASDPQLDVSGSPPTLSDVSLPDALARSKSLDPRVRQALAQLAADEAHTRAIGATLRPDLSLTATLSSRAGGGVPSGNGMPADGDGWIPNVANWNVGIALNWPLFDGTIRARTDAARAQEQVRREELSVIEQQQVAAIRIAYEGVQISRETLPRLARAVDAARANYAQADARFRAGLGTSVELADAEAIRTDAEIQIALGQFEAARARAAFGRAIAEGQ